MSALNDYEEELRAELGAMTVKQLRGYANEHHVPLAGESAKRAIVGEIVAQMRHREYLRRCEAAGVRA